MGKVTGKILATAAVLSILMVGNAFAFGHMDYKGQAREQIPEMFYKAFLHKFTADQQKAFTNFLNEKKTNMYVGSLNNGTNPGWQCDPVDNNPGNGNAPVPEPATMLLFGAGLVGLVGAVRRKANK